MSHSNRQYIQINDLFEIGAVENGDIEGEIYADNEVWAEGQSLLDWRLRHPIKITGEDSCSTP